MQKTLLYSLPRYRSAAETFVSSSQEQALHSPFRSFCLARAHSSFFPAYKTDIPILCDYSHFLSKYGRDWPSKPTRWFVCRFPRYPPSKFDIRASGSVNSVADSHPPWFLASVCDWVVRDVQKRLHSSLLRTARRNRFVRRHLRGKEPLRWAEGAEQSGNSTSCRILRRDRDECRREEPLSSSFDSEDSSADFLLVTLPNKIHLIGTADAVECSFGRGDSACSARNTAFYLYRLFDSREGLRWKESRIRWRVLDIEWKDCLFSIADYCYRMGTLRNSEKHARCYVRVVCLLCQPVHDKWFSKHDLLP